MLTLVCRLLRCYAFARRTNKINTRLCALQKIVRLRDCALVRSCARAALMRLRMCTLLRLRAQLVRVRSGCAYALSLHTRLHAQFALARTVCDCALSLCLRAQFALARSSKKYSYGCKYLSLTDVMQANNVFLWNGSATAAATFFSKLLSAFIVDLEKRGGGGRGGGDVNVFCLKETRYHCSC